MATSQAARGEHRFGPFLLRGPEGPLLKDDAEIRLQRKSLSLLWLLVRRAGQVVTKQEILDALWTDTAVGEDALTFQIKVLRTALGDSARDPRYIATAHGVGFRFVGALGGAPGRASETAASGCFGRDAELSALEAELARASRGKRQIVFVSGDAGIGKSTLVNTFVAAIAGADAATLAARGQCFEQHGAGDAYLAIAGALGQLCRETDGAQVIEHLRRLAPTWLPALPGIIDESERKELEQRLSGATSDRKKIELALALEALTADRTLVLVLEDLHWSDESTLDLISVLARRPEPARLLLIATFRPLDALVARHPVRALKVELVGRSLARELPLGYLRVEDVHRVLAARFSESDANRELAERVHRRTEGHPLFVVEVMEHLEQGGAASGHVAAESLGEVPQSLKDLIELHVRRLDPSAQEVLEAAGIVGAEFAAAACAAALDSSTEAVESACESLSRDSLFIEDRGLAILPDGTVSGRYGFRHSLYEQVLRARVPSAKRARWARRIAERLETAYRQRKDEIAAELAAHFADAALPEREIEARLLAAQRATRMAAPSEAKAQANRGLALLEALPANPDRDRVEFGLVLALAESAYTEHGYGSAEARTTLERLSRLLDVAPDVVSLHRARLALMMSNLYGGRLRPALEISLRSAEIWHGRNAPEPECHALAIASYALFSMGRHVEAANRLETCEELIARISARPTLSSTGAITIFHIVKMCVEWALGHADRAAEHAKQALERAEASRNTNIHGSALAAGTFLALFRREPRAIFEAARSTLEFCESHGESGWAAVATKHLHIARCLLGEARETLPIYRRIVAAEESRSVRLWRTLVQAASAHTTDG